MNVWCIHLTITMTGGMLISGGGMKMEDNGQCSFKGLSSSPGSLIDALYGHNGLNKPKLLLLHLGWNARYVTQPKNKR